MLEEDYPYTSGETEKVGRCRHDPNKIAMKVESYGEVKGTIASIHEKLSTEPLTLAMSADAGTYAYYKGGLIEHGSKFCGQNLNHTIVLVGYDPNFGSVSS